MYPALTAITAMGSGIDIELVKQVLRAKTQGEGAPFSQRGLSRDAGGQEDLVRDILAGRNKNPTIRTLTALAAAMNEPLSIFGLETRRIETNLEALQQALAEALPAMPKRGVERQAQYLAGVVADVLELPPNQPE